MLALKPNCECCDKDLPPQATDAQICSFECSFCAECVESRLNGVYPNCGGAFVPRPIHPTAKLAQFPAAQDRIVKAHADCAEAVMG